MLKPIFRVHTHTHTQTLQIQSRPRFPAFSSLESDCVTARDKDAPFINQFLALLVVLEQSPEKANPTEYFFNAQP